MTAATTEFDNPDGPHGMPADVRHLRPVTVRPDPPEPSGVGGLPEGFWDTEVLEHVYTEALTASCNPAAVITVALVRIAAMTHPVYRTGRARGCPPTSLNLFAAVAGRPGAGKSRTVEVVNGLLPDPSGYAPWFSGGQRPASAAGLAAIFHDRDDDGAKVSCAWLEYDEGAVLLSHSSRQGEPIIAELCSAFVGKDLSSRLRNRSESRSVPKGTYSLGLVLNLQTEAAGKLLEAEGVGLPARFLWCDPFPPREAWDPDAWDEDLRPVLPLGWKPSGGNSIGYSPEEGCVPIRLPEEAKRELHQLTSPDAEPPADRLDDHRPLLKNKTAALLALLHGRTAVEPEDWHRAEQLVELSARTRRGVQVEVAMKAQLDRARQRDAKVQDEVATDRAVEADREARRESWATSSGRPKVLSLLADAGGDGIARGALAKSFGSGYRDTVRALIDSMVASGEIRDDGHRVYAGGGR